MLVDLLTEEIPHTYKEARILSPAPAAQDPEIKLVKRIASSDEAALGELYVRFGQRMLAYALRLTGSTADAEDVVQEALVAVWKGAGRYRGEGRLLAWLLGIVHHTAMKTIRSSFWKVDSLSDEVESSLSSAASTPEEQLQADERRQSVRDGLKRLSPEHRAVLELVFYHGLQLAEVAQVINCPIGTVKSRLSYARKHLRGLLDRQEDI